MNKSRKKPSTTRTPSRQKNATLFNKKKGISGEIVPAKRLQKETELREPTSADVNALAHYLSEIGQYPLLTVEQEQALARRMRAGDAEAYQHFVEANLRLVVSIAMHYHGPEIPLLDRIQEGNLGLMHAATKFDPDLGVHFSTYATYWIRQSIHRAVLAKARLISLPIRTGEQIVKMNRLHGSFLQTQGHELSNEEISQILGLSKEIEPLKTWSYTPPVPMAEEPLDDTQGTDATEPMPTCAVLIWPDSTMTLRMRCVPETSIRIWQTTWLPSDTTSASLT